MYIYKKACVLPMSYIFLLFLIFFCLDIPPDSETFYFEVLCKEYFANLLN